MKKLLPLVLAVLFLLNGAAVEALADGAGDPTDGTISVVASKNEVRPGEEFEVRLELTNNPGFLGTLFSVIVNEEFFEAVTEDIQPGTLTDDADYYASGMVVDWVAIEPSLGDGSLAKLTLRVKEDVPSTDGVWIIQAVPDPNPDNQLKAEGGENWDFLVDGLKPWDPVWDNSATIKIIGGKEIIEDDSENVKEAERDASTKENVRPGTNTLLLAVCIVALGCIVVGIIIVLVVKKKVQ